MISNAGVQEKVPTAKLILDILWECYKPAILKAALELEVWAKLAGGNTTADEVAESEGWDPTGTRMLLDVLCGLELLGKQGEKYHLVPVAEYYLVPGRETYMGDYVLLDMGWEGFGQLADAIRTGKRPIQEDWTGDKFAQIWSSRFAPRRLSPARGLDKFIAIWEKLGVEAKAGLRVLDIACGSGIRSLALARQHPSLQVTLQELPPVLAVAVELAEKLGVSEQVATLPGDLREVNFGQGGYDLVFMGHIMHFLGHSEIAMLFDKAFTALAPGGELIIAEVIADEERCEAQYALLGAIWLYGVSTEGDMFTLSELNSLLKGAGFAGVTLISEDGEDFVKARKL
jgi:2-polyprenyl-3-methyl-5-hydroxy-6-metoxy-1,4-benzoquinol methylase